MIKRSAQYATYFIVRSQNHAIVASGGLAVLSTAFLSSDGLVPEAAFWFRSALSLSFLGFYFVATTSALTKSNLLPDLAPIETEINPIAVLAFVLIMTAQLAFATGVEAVVRKLESTQSSAIEFYFSPPSAELPPSEPKSN